MKRVVVRIGDVFCVPIDKRWYTIESKDYSEALDESSKFKMYFQYIARDNTQLGGQVIRVFSTKYALDAEPDLKEVVQDTVYFYAHVIIRWGLENVLNLWEKVGNVPYKETCDVLFRSTLDYGYQVGEEPVKVSERWRVWRVNEPMRYVGKLEGENRTAEIGVIFDPVSIVERMRTGQYPGFYPDFE